MWHAGPLLPPARLAEEITQADSGYAEHVASLFPRKPEILEQKLVWGRFFFYSSKKTAACVSLHKFGMWPTVEQKERSLSLPQNNTPNIRLGEN